MIDANLAKIVIEQGYSDSDTVDVETPWAEDLGDGLYKLKNSPFYAYGVSYDDVLKCASKYQDDDRRYFERVVEKSGHRTLRIIFDESVKESDRSMAILDYLSSMECGYEGFGGEKFFVINVQPQCDFEAVCEYLIDQEVRWEHADPTYEEIHCTDK